MFKKQMNIWLFKYFVYWLQEFFQATLDLIFKLLMLSLILRYIVPSKLSSPLPL